MLLVHFWGLASPRARHGFLLSPQRENQHANFQAWVCLLIAFSVGLLMFFALVVRLFFMCVSLFSYLFWSRF